VTANGGITGSSALKGHVAIDPDSEIITDTHVSAANVGDGAVAADLIGDLLAAAAGGSACADDVTAPNPGVDASVSDEVGVDSDQPTVYGDSSYGTGEIHELLDEHNIADRCKTQPPVGKDGMFSKDAFTIDLDADTVTCPNDVTVPVRRASNGDGIAHFDAACADCPLRAQCTTARDGRTIQVGRHERHLARARAEQQDPAWRADYRATRPKVERKISHLMFHRHGGRRARVRGTIKIDADFNLLAAAVNLARLARLGVRSTTGGWAAATV
jgi:hypothetical protein